MSKRVVVIGLDAAEATLIERWCGEGQLPSLADLARTGSTAELANPMETLPGAIWPEINTGRAGGKLALYYHPLQLHTGEARLRPVEAEEIDAGDFYWTAASRAGRRVAVIDPVQCVAAPGLNGVQLLEWGLHDRNFDLSSDPPALLAEVRRAYGDYPVTQCDRHGSAVEGYDELLHGLVEGASKKSRLIVDLLRREPWDLVTATFGEPHCAGHQFWHFLDSAHPAHDPGAPESLRNAIRSVYRQVDDGLGAILAAAGPETFVLVVASHGMGPKIGGPQLLPEFLVRMGLGSDSGRARRHGWIRRLQKQVSHLPRPVQPLLRRLANTSALRRMEAASGCLLNPLESPRTRAAALRNNRCGAIRLNLMGREPNGAVRPGPEAAALTETLRAALLALEQPGTRERIVKRVVSAEEAFGPQHHSDVPDLIVVFRTDLGRLEACASEQVGTIEVPIGHPNIPRTGDHTTESRLWIWGPGISSGTRLASANVLDIAPTVLRLLDVPLPPDLDGRPLPLPS